MARTSALLLALAAAAGCRSHWGVDHDTARPGSDSGGWGSGVPAGAAIGVAAGSGVVESDAHRLKLTVGDPVTVHEVTDGEYRLRLGLGTTWPSERP